MDLNVVTLFGRLGRDPELRGEDDNPLCSFSIANSSYKKVNDEFVEDTSWFDCTAWGYNAEKIAERAKKGHRILVTGTLKQRTWEADDGTKREKISVVVKGVQFLEKAPKKDAEPEAEPEPTRDVAW